VFKPSFGKDLSQLRGNIGTRGGFYQLFFTCFFFLTFKTKQKKSQKKEIVIKKNTVSDKTTR
jgi:hypothetical protein